MTKRTKKKKKVKEPSSLRLGVMKQGPGDSVLFHFIKGQQIHKYLTPNCPHFCLAIYRTTNMKTVLGEQVFVFTHNIRRPKA